MFLHLIRFYKEKENQIKMLYIFYVETYIIIW